MMSMNPVNESCTLRAYPHASSFSLTCLTERTWSWGRILWTYLSHAVYPAFITIDTTMYMTNPSMERVVSSSFSHWPPRILFKIPPKLQVVATRKSWTKSEETGGGYENIQLPWGRQGCEDIPNMSDTLILFISRSSRICYSISRSHSFLLSNFQFLWRKIGNPKCKVMEILRRHHEIIQQHNNSRWQEMRIVRKIFFFHK